MQKFICCCFSNNSSPSIVSWDWVFSLELFIYFRSTRNTKISKMAIFVPSDLKWYIQGKKEQIYCVFLNIENNHILLSSIKSIFCKWFPYTFLTFKSIWFCSNFHFEKKRKNSRCDWQDTQIMQILINIPVLNGVWSTSRTWVRE